MANTFTGHHTWKNPDQTVSSAQRAQRVACQTRALRVRWQVAPRLLLERADQPGHWLAAPVRTRPPLVAVVVAVPDVAVWPVVPAPADCQTNHAVA